MGDRDPAPSGEVVTLGVSLKLYLGVDDSRAWAARIADVVRDDADVGDGRIRVFVLPSLPAVPAVATALAGTPVMLGAQDLHWADRGAHTGGISGADLADVGCTLVEVGHAERHSLFGEDAAITARKAAAAVRNGLEPVLCVGEPDRASVDAAVQACRAQYAAAMGEVPDTARTRLILAYEPVWAIGQQQPAPAEHVRAVCGSLRAMLAEDERVTRGTVIYGGSAQGGTLSRLGAGVDGLFLGRFAHDTTSFASILNEARTLLS